MSFAKAQCLTLTEAQKRVPPGEYVHYKGGRYYVTGYRFLSDTEEWGAEYNIIAPSTRWYERRNGELDSKPCVRSIREMTESVDMVKGDGSHSKMQRYVRVYPRD